MEYITDMTKFFKRFLKINYAILKLIMLEIIMLSKKKDKLKIN